MIPRRIEIHNLGAIPYACIDLTNVSLAAITGPNGAGKTTGFTIAPMFALFGTTKNGCSVDDMVRTGATEMAVNFEFEHRREIYRITRGRSTKGRGKSTLELQHLCDGQWVSESGTTIRETEEKIQALLNLDADTFAATSMILQGRANEFTAKPPGQRKAVLAKALGLEQYDRLQEKAKEKAGATKARLDAAKSKMVELDMRLTARDGLNSELTVAESELAGAGEIIAAKEAELAKVERQTRYLEAKTVRAMELDEQVVKVNGELVKSRELRELHQKRLDSANNMLSQKETILAKTAEYEKAREKVAVLQAKRPRLQELSDEENRISSELGRTQGQRRRTGSQIQELESLLANREKFSLVLAECREAEGVLEQIEELTTQRSEINMLALEYERKTAEWDRHQEHKVSQLEKTLTERREQASLLEKVPCAEQDISESCPLIASAIYAQKEIARLETELREVNEKQNPHVERWQALIKERDALGYDPGKHKRLKEQIAEFRPKAQQAAQLDAKAELLEHLKEQLGQSEVQERQLIERLESVKEWARQLSTELQPLAAMEASLPKLKKWAEAKDKLPAAQQAAATAAEALEQIEMAIKAGEEQLNQLEAEHKQLLLESAALATARENEQNLRGYIKSLQVKQNELHGQVGGIKAQLKVLDEAAEERRRLVKEIEPLAKELTRWQTLVKAFGRDGIPALIIENAVPELERISNEILAQMSNGKHSIRFDTQRELKSVKGAVAETLDIIVSDWTGERPYETFSGGEQLRIDFAIRFALAELLARRAGSRVEWLTVDEGLGSQDAKHRALVLEAIKAVADRFRVTLVITHIEEAQAVFDQRIYFEPREDGVEVLVA